MKSIGGFFELELRDGSEYYSKLLSVNTGRNALEYILKENNYKKVFIPYYTCDAILEPLEKLNIKYSFYNIDRRLEVVGNINTNDGEALLYNNYFGIKNLYINMLCVKKMNIIIDNAQSFFSEPNENVDTFYSCRKFFGVSDGGYVSLKLRKNYVENLGCDLSSDRSMHLLRRIDIDAETAYRDYRINESLLKRKPILRMSKLTKSILRNVEYSYVKQRRNENFIFLHKALNSLNELECIEIENISAPMVYPFLTSKKGLKEELIRNKIFVATYWPNVKEWCEEGSVERMLYDNLLALPIDQRYSEEDMAYIIKMIKEW
jgi:hypothetical protein